MRIRTAGVAIAAALALAVAGCGGTTRAPAADPRTSGRADLVGHLGPRRTRARRSRS